MAAITEVAKRLYRARATVRTMLSDRGYMVSVPRNEQSMDSFAMHLLGMESDYTLCIVAKKKKKRVIVYFPTDAKLGVKPIREIVDHLEKQGCAHAIIVYKDAITPFAQREIDEDISKRVTIEKFKLETLLYNVTHHTGVPKHIVLSRKERDEYLQTNSLVADKLPKIFSTDPVIQYYGLKRGQMVKIERFSPEGHVFYYYRIVV